MANKRYFQSYKDSYSKEFPFISKSRLGPKHAFCTCCRCDISISHGGRRDIVLHSETAKHRDNFKAAASSSSILSSFSKSNDDSVINAECLFTMFLIEHNLPLNSSDHAGPLFRKMFPDSTIAKNYGCARTKTSALVEEFSSKEEIDIIKSLKEYPYAVATDGSNDVDYKLYPIVVTFYNPELKVIKNCLLSIPSLDKDATGINIGNLVVDSLESRGISLKNCIAFGCDNAPVMVGNKIGAITVLRKKNKSIELIGCPCHLLNLASEKGTSSLPFKIDEMLVDIYYYLQKSSKRKDRLKVFQQLHNTDMKKILKHVTTRWLSVGKCLSRILDTWKPLVSFFKEEAMVKNDIVPLASFTIPRLKQSENSVNANESCLKANIEEKEKMSKNYKRKYSNDNTNSVKKLKKYRLTKINIVSREERIFYFLSSEVNRAYCLFLTFIVPSFESTNAILQSSDPHIHILRSLLLDLFKAMIVKFVKPSVIKSSHNILEVPYHLEENQKENLDLVVGHATMEVIADLPEENQIEIYQHIRKYFISTCDYMRHKFPFGSETLKHAEVAQLTSFENASFSSVKYFVKKFSALNFCDTVDKTLDVLQKEFNELQIFDISPFINISERIDSQWSSIGKIKNEVGQFRFSKLSNVMLAVLTIPHSNAECERIFSLVKKTRTEYRPSLSNNLLEKLLITKLRQNTVCFDNVFDGQFLKKAKSCTKLKLSCRKEAE